MTKSAPRQCKIEGCGRTTRPGSGKCGTHEYARTKELLEKDPARKEAERLRMNQASIDRRQSMTDRERKDFDLKSKHRITIEQFEQILADQGGLCAICTRPPDGNGVSGNTLHVDHCHKTDVIRGLLCRDCNLGLGQFRDSIQTIDRAIDYRSKPPVSIERLPVVRRCPKVT